MYDQPQRDESAFYLTSDSPTENELRNKQTEKYAMFVILYLRFKETATKWSLYYKLSSGRMPGLK